LDARRASREAKRELAGILHTIHPLRRTEKKFSVAGLGGGHGLGVRVRNARPSLEQVHRVLAAYV
jgi:hypothetical protein